MWAGDTVTVTSAGRAAALRVELAPAPRIVAVSPPDRRPPMVGWPLRISVEGVGWFGAGSAGAAPAALPEVFVGGVPCGGVEAPAELHSDGDTVRELLCQVPPGAGSALVVELATSAGLGAAADSTVGFDAVSLLSLTPRAVPPGQQAPQTFVLALSPFPAVGDGRAATGLARNVTAVAVGGVPCTVLGVAHRDAGAEPAALLVSCVALNMGSATQTAVTITLDGPAGLGGARSSLTVQSPAAFRPASRPRVVSVEPSEGLSVTGGGFANVTLASAGADGGAVSGVRIGGRDAPVSSAAVETDPATGDVLLRLLVAVPPGSGRQAGVEATLVTGLVLDGAAGGVYAAYEPPVLTSVRWAEPGRALLMGTTVTGVVLTGRSLPPPAVLDAAKVGSGGGAVGASAWLELSDGLGWRVRCDASRLVGVSDTELRCESLALGWPAAAEPAATAALTFVLSVGGHTAAPPPVLAITRPSVVFLLPASGPQAGGFEATIKGAGLGSDPAQVRSVVLGGRNATVVSATDDGTSLTITVPPGFGSEVTLEVTLANGRTGRADVFSYHEPRLVRVSPSYSLFGFRGSLDVLLVGQSLGPDAGVEAEAVAEVGGRACASLRWRSPEELLCRLMVDDALALPGTDAAVSFRSSSFRLGDAFEPMGRPCVTSLTPRSARQGQTVLVVGTGFGRAGSDVASVRVGDVPCESWTMQSPTALSCAVPVESLHAGEPYGLPVRVVLATGAGSQSRDAEGDGCGDSGSPGRAPETLFSYTGQGRAPAFPCWGVGGVRQPGFASAVIASWRCADAGLDSPLPEEAVTSIDVEFEPLGGGAGAVQTMPPATVLASETVLPPTASDRASAAAAGVPRADGLAAVHAFGFSVSGTPATPVRVRVRLRNAFGEGPWANWSAPVASVCAEGQYLRDVGPAEAWVCVPCQRGAACPERSGAGSVAAAPGYWKVPFSTHGLGFAGCVPALACTGAGAGSNATEAGTGGSGAGGGRRAQEAAPGSGGSRQQSCAPGHGGPMCALCEPGFAPGAQGLCQQCPPPSDSAARTAGIAVAALTALVAVVAISARSKHRKRQAEALQGQGRAAIGRAGPERMTSAPRLTLLSGRSAREVGAAAGTVAADGTTTNPLHAGLALAGPASGAGQRPPPLSIPGLAAGAGGAGSAPPPARRMPSRTSEASSSGLRSPQAAEAPAGAVTAPAKKRSTVPMVLKCLISYAQTVVIVSKLDVAWPDVLTSLFDGFDVTSSVSADTLSLDCVLQSPAEARTIGERPVFVKAAVSLVLPAAALALLLLVALAANAFLAARAGPGAAASRGRRSTGPRVIAPPAEADEDSPAPGCASRVQTSALVAAMVLTFVVQSSSTRTALRLLTCVGVGDAEWEVTNAAAECDAGSDPTLPGLACGDGRRDVLRAAQAAGALRRHLAADLGVDCSDPAAAPYLYGLGLSSFLAYGLGVPLAGLLLLLAYRDRLHAPAVQARLGFLYLGFRGHGYLWETLVILRKTLLGVTTVFLAPLGPNIQATASSLVLGVFIAAQASARPYTVPALNHAELASLLSCHATMLGGLMLAATSVDESPAFFNAIVAGVVVVNVLCIAMFVRAFVLALRRDGAIGRVSGAAKSAMGRMSPRAEGRTGKKAAPGGGAGSDKRRPLELRSGTLSTGAPSSPLSSPGSGRAILSHVATVTGSEAAQSTPSERSAGFEPTLVARARRRSRAAKGADGKLMGAPRA